MTSLWREDIARPYITRYGLNGIPYQVSHNHPSNDERMRNSIQGYSMSTHLKEQDPEDGQKPQQCRRTPVACRRCRKRKIKCSGPQGDDGCHKCKLAGTNDHCQFNRVHSEELPFVKDSFNYDSSAALRTLHRSRGLPCYTATYGTPSMGNTLGSQQSYRQLPLNDYQYPTKAAYYAPPPYGPHYTDDVDYNIMPHTFQQLNQDQIGLQYAPNPPARPWTPAPGLKAAGNAACYDPDPSCAYAPALLAASALTSNERVLPMPPPPPAPLRGPSDDDNSIQHFVDKERGEVWVYGGRSMSQMRMETWN